VARWFSQRYVRTSVFPLRGSEPHAVLRRHLPFIEPDVQISRIRIGDQDSRRRMREAARSSFELHQPEAAQVRFRVA
jgi:hypothetical protein